MKKENKLLCRNKDGIWTVDFSNIIYFEFTGKKITLHTEKMTVTFYDTMCHLQEILPDYFVRCHRGFIINMNQLLNISFGNHSLLVRTGAEIPISRGYKENLKKYLELDKFYSCRKEI